MFLDQLHVDLSGSVLYFCIVKLKLLEHENILISRDASKLCLRKAELLRTLESDDNDEHVVKQKLSEDRFGEIMQYFQNSGHVKRYVYMLYMCIVYMLCPCGAPRS